MKSTTDNFVQRLPECGDLTLRDLSLLLQFDMVPLAFSQLQLYVPDRLVRSMQAVGVEFLA